MKQTEMKKMTFFKLVTLVALVLVVFSACQKDDDEGPAGPDPSFLASSVDELGEVDLGNFIIPTSYDITGDFAPGAYNGQKRRLAQLKEIVDSSRNEPIFWDLKAALSNENRDQFQSADAQGNSDIRTKIDELNFDNGNTSVADAFADLAEKFTTSSQANYTVTASNGVAGMITTGSNKRHVSANGLEFIQLLEKGLYGAMMYDQMVDDYLRPSQAGAENTKGNNESAAGADYATSGTDRQHRWDEVFGYLGADPDSYPNASNTSNGDGQFIANYTFDFSDETEEVFGINLADKLMDAFIFGRAVLKAGEGFGPSDETTNEAYYEAARKDIKLYTELGIATAAYHYLNSAIADITEEDKLHHLSEALAFIYSLSFNAEGRISASQVHDVLIALGWSSSDASLNGVYDINLWEVTDDQMQKAKDLLDVSYPGFGAIPF
ncbi:MAG: DUF4856 domain-containing protein [Saprospiraceae bacterium]|nr:DUF4856 domain-containing protein [Saprospiraceae bacterium]